MRRQGFTIIELMVTITIIGLLLAVTSIYLGNGQVIGRDAKRLSDISLIGKTIDTAMAANHGAYPTFAASGTAKYKDCPDKLPSSGLDLSVFPKSTMPSDPRPQTSPSGSACSDVSRGYIYAMAVPSTDTSTPTNEANKLTRAYLLEVGLEQTANSDESQLTLATALPAAGLPVINGRTTYVLQGPYVGP